MRNYYIDKPEHFMIQLEVIGCYIKVQDKLLILKRSATSKEPHTWTVPSGKIESGESLLEGAQRELFEETGIVIDFSPHAKLLGSLYIEYDQLQYVYHFCHVYFDFNNSFPKIILSHEHEAFMWATAEELTLLPITGGYETVARYNTLI